MTLQKNFNFFVTLENLLGQTLLKVLSIRLCSRNHRRICTKTLHVFALYTVFAMELGIQMFHKKAQKATY